MGRSAGNGAARGARPEVEVRCRQILEPDGSVFSLQSLDLPPGAGMSLETEGMLERYFLHVRRTTLFLVRPVRDGNGIRFTLLGSPLALLRFLPPRKQVSAAREELRLQIDGGLLVQRAEAKSGAFSLVIDRHDDRITLSLQLAGFCPMLLGSRHPSLFGRLLYGFTQARIHSFTGVRFLCRLYRELAGIAPIPQRRQVALREGREI